jgi:antitoxin ParD1/3/4
MRENTSIALGDHFEAYARRKVETGQFSSISEVIRDGLRRAEVRDLRIEGLRELIREFFIGTQSPLNTRASSA